MEGNFAGEASRDVRDLDSVVWETFKSQSSSTSDADGGDDVDVPSQPVYSSIALLPPVMDAISDAMVPGRARALGIVGCSQSIIRASRVATTFPCTANYNKLVVAAITPQPGNDPSDVGVAASPPATAEGSPAPVAPSVPDSSGGPFEEPGDPIPTVRMLHHGSSIAFSPRLPFRPDDLSLRPEAWPARYFQGDRTPAIDRDTAYINIYDEPSLAVFVQYWCGLPRCPNIQKRAIAVTSAMDVSRVAFLFFNLVVARVISYPVFFSMMSSYFDSIVPREEPPTAHTIVTPEVIHLRLQVEELRELMEEKDVAARNHRDESYRTISRLQGELGTTNDRFERMARHFDRTESENSELRRKLARLEGRQ